MLHGAGDTQGASRRSFNFRETNLASVTNATGAWRGTRTIGTQGSMYPRDLRMAPSANPFGQSATSLPYSSGGHTARHESKIDRNRSRLLTWCADTAEAGRTAMRKEDLRRTLTAPPPQPRPATDKVRLPACPIPPYSALPCPALAPLGRAGPYRPRPRYAASRTYEPMNLRTYEPRSQRAVPML